MYIRDIAQKIVNLMMEVIDNRNINIMDCEGFILASGEPNRIATYHKGADDVIKSGKAIEIFPEDIGQFPGAKQGVNLPINIEGKIIGVVGVFGHPDEVRMVARLVKNSVELALEQYLISEQVNLVKDLKNQLIRKLIFNPIIESEEEILCLSKVAHVDLKIKRCAVVIKLDNFTNEEIYESMNAMGQIEKNLYEKNLITKNDFFGVINHYFIIFKAIDDSKRICYRNSIQYIFEDQQCYHVKIGFGNSYKDLYGYKKSFNEAVELISISKKEPLDIKDFETQSKYLLHKIQTDVSEPLIKELYALILDENNKVPEWFYKTLEALFEHNLNLNETAGHLFVHKNTLVYRVKKIEQITGLSINNFYHGVLLYCLYAFINKHNSGG
ncbi:helix-turn-helix domain-containing protein [Vallitalea pronyensis]|uniref:Helix-turn-helix domain-containing protein n=1 Tax=Vallitalea pronyensis TaxID=1348613 RepID=A0A8J8MLM3_9FIRM|nr:sugar diacid recognition domain-containing protein [Vallitalea pronyensis]QUI23791.1 helix-turn-helix domain-containing protein [Vallitalea pronyensis]